MSQATQHPDIEICPPTGTVLAQLTELFRYRELVRHLVWWRVRSRFEGLRFRFLWAVWRALIVTLVFVFIRRLSDGNMGGSIPYPVYLFSGLSAWFYIAGAINSTVAALADDATLVRKVYFPRLASLVSPMFANLIELVTASPILVAMMVYFDLWPGWELLLLPLVLAQMFALILGVGLIFITLSHFSRDWNQLLAVILYIGMFASPVVYSAERLPEAVQVVYYLNPAVGTLTAIRSCLFDSIAFPWAQWTYSVGVSVALLLVGLVVFRRTEYELLDLL